MDDEIKNFIKVWILSIACLTYCYFIPLKIPKGKFRLISLLPIFYFLTILPLNLTTISLGGMSAFFLSWLANFKLFLFSFGQGPLSSNPSISFSHFISIACFPIKLKNKEPPSPQNTKLTSSDQQKPQKIKINGPPSPQISTKSPKSSLDFAIKTVILALLSVVYEHKQHIHPKVMLAYYCCYMYLGLELILAIIATMVRTFLGLELEPQFNDPYLATSLQDFWGRRWNLMVSNILRPTVYLPIRSISTQIVGRKGAQLVAVLMTFVASGLMHEIIFYYLGRLRPTWEVTCFFILHGMLVVLEIVVKRVLKDRWRLHPLVSWAYTIATLLVTGNWLFFPQMLRFNTDVRSSIEVMAAVNFFIDLGKLIPSSVF